MLVFVLRSTASKIIRERDYFGSVLSYSRAKNIPYSTTWGNLPWLVVTWNPKQLLGDLLSLWSFATREENWTASGITFDILMN